MIKITNLTLWAIIVTAGFIVYQFVAALFWYTIMYFEDRLFIALHFPLNFVVEFFIAGLITFWAYIKFFPLDRNKTKQPKTLTELIRSSTK